MHCRKCNSPNTLTLDASFFLSPHPDQIKIGSARYLAIGVCGLVTPKCLICGDFEGIGSKEYYIRYVDLAKNEVKIINRKIDKIVEYLTENTYLIYCGSPKREIFNRIADSIIVYEHSEKKQLQTFNKVLDVYRSTRNRNYKKIDSLTGGFEKIDIKELMQTI